LADDDNYRLFRLLGAGPDERQVFTRALLSTRLGYRSTSPQPAQDLAVSEASAMLAVLVMLKRDEAKR